MAQAHCGTVGGIGASGDCVTSDRGRQPSGQPAELNSQNQEPSRKRFPVAGKFTPVFSGKTVILATSARLADLVEGGPNGAGGVSRQAAIRENAQKAQIALWS